MVKKAKMKYQLSVYTPYTVSGSKVVRKFTTKNQAEKAFEKILETKFVMGKVEKIPTQKKTKFSIFGIKLKR